MIEDKILNIIKRKFDVREIDLSFLENYSTFNNFTNIGNHNAFNFLTEINREFEIDIDYKGRFLYELEDLVYKYLNLSNSNNLEETK
ncbi:hypothetical protein [Romboutsia sp. MSSM.1001216sp_RTP31141st1_G3_RTP31141_220114]|uniref:hypothetical protein n=1 Tax=unclassified Romboutsia TaxID=2626894 RepID=UPI0031B58998